MGLDAYIFRIERPTEEELKKLSDLSLSEINDLGYNYIEAEAFERNLDLYQSVIWHARRITAKTKGLTKVIALRHMVLILRSLIEVIRLVKEW